MQFDCNLTTYNLLAHFLIGVVLISSSCYNVLHTFVWTCNIEVLDWVHQNKKLILIGQSNLRLINKAKLHFTSPELHRYHKVLELFPHYISSIWMLRHQICIFHVRSFQPNWSNNDCKSNHMFPSSVNTCTDIAMLVAVRAVATHMDSNASNQIMLV